MRVIAISSYKGGSGKTTTAVNMAYNLAAVHNKKTLVVDTDPQGNASYMLGKHTAIGKNLYHALMGQATMSQVIRRTKYNNLDLLPCTEKMEELEGLAEDKLKNLLSKVRDKYDYVIIDCHPSMQISTIGAMVAADDLIVPVKPDRFNVNGLELMADYIEQIKEYNPMISFFGCLVVMYKGTRSQNSVITELAGASGYPICETVISNSEAVNTAQGAKKPLLKHRSKSKAAVDYSEFVKEYLERVE